ncbi:hypothetical protein AB0903_09635 [Streptomyces sp. NPDC048389]|uniref:hypothetical protein n=1 Tax=Streptomyces sp. NPDC048389 TaxID=3154622 RepID=UPI0034512171
MKTLILQLALIVVAFLALLVVLGAQIGAMELGIMMLAVVAAVTFTVLNHRKRNSTDVW